MSRAQTNIGEPPGRIAPARELANTFEYEAMAQRSLSAAAFAEIAGSDGAAAGPRGSDAGRAGDGRTQCST